MEKVLTRLKRAGLVPVAVIENETDAVQTAQALLLGGIDVMEVTFRTVAAAGALRRIAKDCPDMLVGAGTVTTLDQCKQAVDAGAQFLVSPGFDEMIVDWCVKKEIAIIPGCVTPSEIMAAMRLGIRVLKFFPAGAYGGLDAIRALAGPFGTVQFIPTGGVNTQNIGTYLAAPFVYAVGGSWVCSAADIAEHRFAHITALCAEARKAALGFELIHVGVNCATPEISMAVCGELSEAFGFDIKHGNRSNFSGKAIEVMKGKGRGESGHLAIGTNSVAMAVAALGKNGYSVDRSTARYEGERMSAVYLTKEFGGFAVHLVQK